MIMSGILFALLADITVSQATVNGKTCDVVAWTDANGQPRTAAFVRSNGDVGGRTGGYIERYTYTIDGVVKTGVSNEGQTGVSGLGVAVNHYADTAATSKANVSGATSGFLFQGAGHAVWRYSGTMTGGANSAGLVIDWLVQDGRNDVLWAVSYDTSSAAGNFDWDARGPYFQFDWDGDGQFYNGTISGIRWGDRYRFRTTSYNPTNGAASAWDYATPNTIPYVTLWKAGGLGNVESGVVMTQPWTQKDAGGYWWAGGAGGTTGTGMPENWNCPFQLNAYEGYAGEKMAWGSNYGFVGNNAYAPLVGAARSGRPRQGYATYIILNKHSDGLTDGMIGSMEAVQQTTLTASTGSVVTSGPGYAGLAATQTYQPAGWDPVRGAWRVTAGASNQAAFNFAVAAGTQVRPLIIIGNYGAAGPPGTLTFNGATLTLGTDYAASVNDPANELWVTLKRNVSGGTNGVTLGAAAPPPPGPAPAPAPAPAPGGGTPSGSEDDGSCGCSSSIRWIPGLGGALAAGLALALGALRRG
jgi:hypothetical protein